MLQILFQSLAAVKLCCNYGMEMKLADANSAAPEVNSLLALERLLNVFA